jgi:hypothetical protein
MLLVCKENLQCGESGLRTDEAWQLVEQWKFVIKTVCRRVIEVLFST